MSRRLNSTTTGEGIRIRTCFLEGSVWQRGGCLSRKKRLYILKLLCQFFHNANNFNMVGWVPISNNEIILVYNIFFHGLISLRLGFLFSPNIKEWKCPALFEFCVILPTVVIYTRGDGDDPGR